jgi:hypothetical protein
LNYSQQILVPANKAESNRFVLKRNSPGRASGLIHDPRGKYKLAAGFLMTTHATKRMCPLTILHLKSEKLLRFILAEIREVEKPSSQIK